MKKSSAFQSEAALCTEFISHATEKGDWINYNECGGWDILLVRKSDGFQIGIQAKLKFNVKVLEQSLPDSRYDFATTGPDCRAILVPESECGGLTNVCRFLGVVVIKQRPPLEDGKKRAYWQPRAFTPELPGSQNYRDDRDWPEWAPERRVKLPDFVPDVVAGCAAPVQLTEWKIKAIKMSILLEQRPVTRSDFKALKLDPSRWTNYWLIRRDGAYVPNKNMPNFRAQHPVNYEQIKAEAETWMKELEPKGALL